MDYLGLALGVHDDCLRHPSLEENVIKIGTWHAMGLARRWPWRAPRLAGLTRLLSRRTRHGSAQVGVLGPTLSGRLSPRALNLGALF